MLCKFTSIYHLTSVLTYNMHERQATTFLPLKIYIIFVFYLLMKLFVSCFIALSMRIICPVFFLCSNYKYVFRVFLKFNSDTYVFPLLYIKVQYMSLTFINERYLSIFFIYQSQVFLPCYF